MKCNPSLKQIYSRKLRNGAWVVVSANSDPLVVDESVAMDLAQVDESMNRLDDETRNILMESGFFAESPDCNHLIPAEDNSLKWKILRYGLISMGVISFILMLVVTPFIGIPIGNDIIPNNVPFWITAVFVLVFSLSTTLLHEIMHMVYARVCSCQMTGLRLQIKKATASVDMTHIWVWSFLPRLSALSAGLISDLFLLVCLSCAQLFFSNWMLVTASSILWIRILWQFGFHRNCDGQLIAMTIIDNPMIAIDTNDTRKSATKNEDIQIWRKLKIVGHIIYTLLFVFWLIPFVLSIMNYLNISI